MPTLRGGKEVERDDSVPEMIAPIKDKETLKDMFQNVPQLNRQLRYYGIQPKGTKSAKIDALFSAMQTKLASDASSTAMVPTTNSVMPFSTLATPIPDADPNDFVDSSSYLSASQSIAAIENHSSSALSKQNITNESLQHVIKTTKQAKDLVEKGNNANRSLTEQGLGLLGQSLKSVAGAMISGAMSAASSTGSALYAASGAGSALHGGVQATLTSTDGFDSESHTQELNKRLQELQAEVKQMNQNFDKKLEEHERQVAESSTAPGDAALNPSPASTRPPTPDYSTVRTTATRVLEPFIPAEEAGTFFDDAMHVYYMGGDAAVQSYVMRELPRRRLRMPHKRRKRHEGMRFL